MPKRIKNPAKAIAALSGELSHNSDDIETTSATDTATLPTTTRSKAEIGRLGGMAKGLNRLKLGDKTQISKLDQIFNKITAILDNKERLSEATVSQLGILMGIVCDKKLLLSNRPNVLHGVISVHEAGDRTLSALDRLSTALQGRSPQRVIDIQEADSPSIPAKP